MIRPAPLIAAVALACAAPAAAQISVEPIEEMEEKAPATPQDAKAADDTDLVIVPIPQSSPTLGTGVTLVGVLFYNPFKEPSPWVTGVGIMRTSNGSQAIAALHRMSLGGDKVRVVLFGGHAQINVNFY